MPDPLCEKLWRVVGVAVNRNPFARYASARAMMLALDWVVREDALPCKKPQASVSDIFQCLISPCKPDPLAMTAFKHHIHRIIDYSIKESAGPDGNGVLTRKAFTDITGNVCSAFERRIGFLRPSSSLHV